MAKRRENKDGNGGMPTGTVLPFAGTTAPTGWLLCQGQEVSRTDYANLDTVISTTYGSYTNGSGGAGTSHFRLPDMRGVFPRGAGTNGTANYGGVSGHTPAAGSVGNKGGQKTARNGINVTNSSSSVTVNKNQWNSDQVSHTHSVSATALRVQLGSGGSNAFREGGASIYSSFADSISGTAAGSTSSWNSVNATGTAAAQGTTVTGDSETTPAFLALNYIIKL